MGEVGQKITIMGILNLTPDSFSDGGLWEKPQAALGRIEELIGAGANVIDLGAVSTRPGAKDVTLEEEWRRLEPVLKPLSKTTMVVSVDTSKPEIMDRALDYGVSYINNVNGVVADEWLLSKCASSGITYIAMHTHGVPETMLENPLYPEESIKEVEVFFQDSFETLKAAGFAEDKILLDPGIGFGKAYASNFALLGRVGAWASRFPLAIGVSRKSFIGKLCGISSPKARDTPTKIMEWGLALAGVRLIRTHEVGRLKELLVMSGVGLA